MPRARLHVEGFLCSLLVVARLIILRRILFAVRMVTNDMEIRAMGVNLHTLLVFPALIRTCLPMWMKILCITFDHINNSFDCGVETGAEFIFHIYFYNFQTKILLLKAGSRV